MTLKEYVDNLNKILADNPKAAEYEVVTSIDDEGNGYNRINYGPTLGILFDYNEFSPYDPDDEDNEEFVEDDINAICVN